jgi:hypothetical protein
MRKNNNLERVFSVVWIAAGVANGLRGDWLGLAAGFALGVGMLLARRATRNAQGANSNSPLMKAGLGLGFFGLAVMLGQIANDIVTKLLR